MASLPRGISEVKYTTDEGRIVKYRVRIRRKDYQVDEVFDKLDDAKNFLLNSKTKEGREANVKKSLQQTLIEEFYRSPPLEAFINKYLDEHYTHYPKYDTLLRKKQCQSVRSFFKTISNTSLPISKNIHAENGYIADLLPTEKKPLGKFKVEEFDYIVVNNYIKERKAQGKAKSTILKEVSLLAGFFEELKHISKTSADKLNGTNPAKEWNRKLLPNAQTKKAKRINDDEYNKILSSMFEVKDAEVFEVFLLGLYTSMRRSEILFLEWEQIKTNYIALTHTKSKRPRNVVLTKDAKDLLSIIGEKKEKKGKVFNITLYSFEKNWQRLQKQFDFKQVNFHCVRKESISTLVDKLGSNSSLVVAELLGISNITTLEKEYFDKKPDLSTEEGIIQHAGHAKKQTTKDHYYSRKTE